jgi:O-antigen ligase
MLTVGHQKIDALALAVVTAFIGGATVLSVAVPELLPWSFVALIGLAVLLYAVARWEITLWAWLYVFSYGLLDWPQWRVRVTGFFNMTVPRFVFLAVMLAFGLYFLFNRRRVRYDRMVLWVMLALTVCIAISSTTTGWTSSVPDVRSAPYFRFLGSILLPFLIFFWMYNATSRESQIRWALILLSVFGWYALYIGYLQYAAVMGAGGAKAFIWPAHIMDPTFGIHVDRGRGPFPSAPPQAVFLVLLFFTDLFLIRKVHGPYRAALVVQAVLTPPAIFFAGMRSGYVAFALCGVVWCLWADRGRFGKTKLGLALLAGVVGAAMFWTNLLQEKRQVGGIAQRAPVTARFALLAQTWEMVKERPLTGVGFGHFADAQLRMPRSPATLVGATVGTLTEHNLFLNMAAETGLIGLVLTIAVFWLIFAESRRLNRKLPPTAAGMLCPEFVVLFWVAMVNYLTDATFRDPLWDNFNNGFFWAFAGLVAGYNRLLEPQPLDLPYAIPALEV